MVLARFSLLRVELVPYMTVAKHFARSVRLTERPVSLRRRSSRFSRLSNDGRTVSTRGINRILPRSLESNSRRWKGLCCKSSAKTKVGHDVPKQVNQSSRCRGAERNMDDPKAG
jgi:hypothetical protein